MDLRPVTTEETRALVLHMLQEAGSSGDFAVAMRNHSNAKLRLHMANGEVGGIELAAGSTLELYTAFPDASLTLEGLIVDGAHAAIQINLLGTHTGPFRGFPPTGKSVHIPACIGIRAEGGYIVEAWYYVNLFAPLVATYAESHPDGAV